MENVSFISVTEKYFYKDVLCMIYMYIFNYLFNYECIYI